MFRLFWAIGYKKKYQRGLDTNGKRKIIKLNLVNLPFERT